TLDQRGQLDTATDTGVIVEMQLRHRAQLHRLAQLHAREAALLREDAQVLLDRILVIVLAHDCDEHLGMGQITTDLDAGDGDQPEARILDFALDQRRQLTLHLIAYTLGAAVIFCHDSYLLKRRKLEARSRRPHGRRPASDFQLPACVCLQRARHFDFFEYFDLVASLDVVVALHADTALHAGTHLGNVILEAAKRFQLAFEDDHVVTQHADRTVAVHHALKDHAARDRTEFRRAEHVAHFGDTQNVLANIAAEHAGQGFLDVLDDVVDHVVVTQIQTFLLDDPACAGVGPHVEAEQHRIGRQRQVGIAFGDTTDAAANDAHLHFIVTQAAERALQG